jgi:segregation and condensation protein A
MEYRVALESFHGPLDLLLYLVRRNEIDILDIPIAALTAQYLEFMEALPVIDVERAGEFLVMAATLMEIKSQMLLPRPPETNEGEEDPRRELVRQLIEYRKFKDAAAHLEDRAEAQSVRMAREAPPEPATEGAPPVRAVELWDLVAAFGRLLREAQALQPQNIIVDDTPMHVYQQQIRNLLRDGRWRLFDELFLAPHSRSRLIGVFLAVLEMIKLGELFVEQPERFGAIRVSLRPTEPPE